jgi:hypothetical protein
MKSYQSEWRGLHAFVKMPQERQEKLAKKAAIALGDLGATWGLKNGPLKVKWDALHKTIVTNPETLYSIAFFWKLGPDGHEKARECINRAYSCHPDPFLQEKLCDLGVELWSERDPVEPIVAKEPEEVRMKRLVANQAVAQSRPKVEKVDQRDKLLAELDAEIKEYSGNTKEAEEKLRKIEARERVQQKAMRSARSARHRGVIEENLAKIEKEKEPFKQKIVEEKMKRILMGGPDDADLPVNSKDRFEQRRRRIIMKFPRPGDPKYVEVKVEGAIRILDEKEAEEYARLENSRDPQRVADQYIQRLIERGILKSAEFVGIEQGLDHNPATGGSMTLRIRIYNYRVNYISKAGLLNERVCGVGLASNGGYWAVSHSTKFGTLLGLP